MAVYEFEFKDIERYVACRFDDFFDKLGRLGIFAESTMSANKSVVAEQIKSKINTFQFKTIIIINCVYRGCYESLFIGTNHINDCDVVKFLLKLDTYKNFV